MKTIIFSLLLLLTFSCKNRDQEYDASGTFEADELLVTAKATGTLLKLTIEEGQQLTKNQEVGTIDPAGAELQKEQALAAVEAIEQKTGSSAPQVQVLQAQFQSQRAQITLLQEQLRNAIRERNRTASLVRADAATRKQLDDAGGQVDVIQRQIDAAQTQLTTINSQMAAARQNTSLQNRAVLSERKPAEKRVQQIEEQLKNNRIESPVSGMVLTKYANEGEFVTPGKPLFKVAGLGLMTLKTYLTGDQLPKVKTGQQVTVLVETGEGKTKELPGTLYWISSKAEFTPKTIQTKNERANLVYAAKIHVINDGYLKIGMYGDVKF